MNELRIRQHVDGGWGLEPTDVSNPLPTAVIDIARSGLNCSRRSAAEKYHPAPFSPKIGWITANNLPIAGEYRAIGLDLQGISPQQAQAL